MKQSVLIRSAFALSFLFMVIISQAQDTSAVSMKILPDSTGERFLLTVFNPEKKKLQLSIYHASSGSVYSEQFNKVYLQKTYNLSGAEDGLYKVEIKNGHKRYSCGVNINTHTQVTRKMELQ